MTLRKEYLAEWRVWYSMQYKAQRDGIEIKPDWLDFESWFYEVGARPADDYHFCRDNSHWNALEPWNEKTAGWRRMPCGRKNHKYSGYYATTKVVLDKLSE